MAGGETLDATLDLDYSEAISGASGLTDAIEQAMEEGATAGAAAIADALAGATGTTGAVEIPVEVDAEAAAAEIAGIGSSVDPIEIPVNIDDAAVSSEIEGIGSGISAIDIPVDVTGGEEVQSLSDSLSEVGDQGGHAKEGLDSSASSAALLGGVAAASKGEIGGVAEKLREVGPGAAVAVGGAVAVGAGIGELVRAGIAGKDATTTFTTTLGQFAHQVEEIHVGTLNTTLVGLGHQLGSTKSEMELAASASFRYADAAGVGGSASAKFTTQVFALAGRAIGLNSSLGNVADVSETLTNRLGRGGARLAQYGISLSTAEIKSHALNLGLGDLSGNLSAQERAIAAADLAVKKYGDSIGPGVAGASQLASVQIANLSARFRESIEEIGKPLVVPAIEALKELVPVGTNAARVIAAIGSASLPLVGTLGGIAIPLQQVSSILSGLPGPVTAAVTGLGLLYLALTKIAGAGGISGASFGAQLLGERLTRMAPAGIFAGAAIGALGIASQNATESTIGLAIAGASLGTLIMPGLGTAIGAVAGGLAGYFAVALQSGSGTTQLEESQKRLHDQIASQNVPVLTNLIAATRRAAKEDVDAEQAVARHTNAASNAVVGIEALSNSQVRHEVSARAGKAVQEEFNAALEKSPAAALSYIAAADQAGFSTEKFSLQLQTSIQAQNLAAQSTASLKAQTQPLATTFQEAAVAAGEQAQQQFLALGALGQMVDADAKAEAAHNNFVKAVASGNETQVRQAAVADATAVAMQTYNDALVAGVPATQASTQANAAAAEELNKLADSPGLSDAQRATIRGLADDLGRLSQPVHTEVTVEGGDAIVKIAAIQAAVHDLVTHPGNVTLLLNDLGAASGLADVQQAMLVIQQDPTQATVILQDLASGNLADIQARFDALPSVQTATALVQTFGQGDVTALAASLQGLQPKTVQAIAQAVGAGDVNALAGIMQGLPNVDRNAIAHALGFGDLASLGGAMLAMPNVDRNAVAHALGFADVEALAAAIARVTDKHATVTVEAKQIGDLSFGHVYGYGFGNQATGGVVKAATGRAVGDSRLTEVGEHGRELLALPIGSRVVSNENTRSMVQAAARGVGGGGDLILQIDARGATVDAVAELKRVDWRGIGAKIDGEKRSRAFLSGR